MRLFLYIRVSSEEQARHGHSLAAQETALTQWAENNHHEIIGVYRDEGISGRKPYTKRPEMVRLLSDIEILRPDLVIFTKLDRWFRNIKEYYKVQEILDAYKVQWKAIHEDYDTTTSSGRLHVNIMLSVAQDEADRTSERIRAVQADLVAKGRPISGSVPLGFKIEKVDGVKRIVKNEAEAAELIDIIQSFTTHQSLQATNVYINEKYNRRRHKVTLKGILSNSLLCGAYGGNNNFTQGYISHEEYDAIQAILKRNIRKPRTDRVYLFTGLLRCPVCNNSMGGATDRHEILRYRCQRHTEKLCPHDKGVSEKIIESYLKDNIFTAFEKYRIDVMKNYKRKRQDSPEKYKARLSRLNDTYVIGAITQEEYTAKAKELQAKIASLSVDIPDFAKQERVLNDDFLSLYETLDKAAKRSLWRQLISEIVLDSNSRPVGIVFLQ